MAKTRGRCVSRGRHAEQVIRPLAFVCLVHAPELCKSEWIRAPYPSPDDVQRIPQEGPKTGKGNVVYWKIYHFYFQAINSVFWAQCDKGQMCSSDCPKRKRKEPSSSVVRASSAGVSLSLCWAHWNSSGGEKCELYLPGRITVAFHGHGGESNLFCK